MLPFTLLELTTQLKKLFPDKSSVPSGITNRMLQAGDAEFQSLLVLLFNGIWEFHVQPTEWQLSLMQPIYKGHDQNKTDPASYRGMYLNDTLAKPFEGLLLVRLTTHTELDNTLTSNHLGTKPCTQTHDAIYSLISTIQYNKNSRQKTTYVAFVDYSTAYPSVHRDRLSSILLHNGIVGHIWHHLRARIDNTRLRVLHPNIQEHQTVDILRRLPEGSRLSPNLFGIFVADRIHELQTKFPHAVINLAPGLQHNGTTQIGIGGLLYVDDLALMSTCPRELQAMLHVCQNGVFEIACRSTHRRQKSWLSSRPPPSRRPMVASTDPAQPYPLFHIHAPFPTSSPCSYLITEILQFEYLEDLSSTPNSPCTSQLPKLFDAPHTASP